MILAFETSTDICSLALWQNGAAVALHEYYPSQLHARLATAAVKQMLENLEIKPSALQAVAVSAGPGSYTGLRIGVSAAKGLCFALGVPLVAVSTLQALAATVQPIARQLSAEIVPLIDARRMEVYTARFSADLEMLSPESPFILTPETAPELAGKGRVLYVGNGTAKCQNLLSAFGEPYFFAETGCSALTVARLAEEKLKRGEVEHLAAFEPNYIKSFQATVGKPKL